MICDFGFTISNFGFTIYDFGFKVYDFRFLDNCILNRYVFILCTYLKV